MLLKQSLLYENWELIICCNLSTFYISSPAPPRPLSTKIKSFFLFVVSHLPPFLFQSLSLFFPFLLLGCIHLFQWSTRVQRINRNNFFSGDCFLFYQNRDFWNSINFKPQFQFFSVLTFCDGFVLFWALQDLRKHALFHSFADFESCQWWASNYFILEQCLCGGSLHYPLGSHLNPRSNANLNQWEGNNNEAVEHLVKRMELREERETSTNGGTEQLFTYYLWRM